MFYKRNNGIYVNGFVRFSIQKVYNSINVYFGMEYFGYSVYEVVLRLCIFIYNGVKYVGLKWVFVVSLNIIKIVIYE